jgi:hypothetical protein
MSQTSAEINSTTKRLNNALRHKEIFDPRIIDNDEKTKALWNSESINLAIKGLSEGYKLRDNPFLKSVKGGLLKKASLPFKYTDDELKILSICAEDKEFFGDNFCKLKDAEKGWQNITLRNYQRKLLKSYSNNKWNIVLFPRQSGKTTTTIIDIVHFLIFNWDKDCVCIAQSDKVVNEILAKIKECFMGLPPFMQPGFITFNKKGCSLDNGCRLSIGIASESVVQGFALDYLYIDEYAYIKPSMVRTFWGNIYPSLVNNPNSKCVITSTPNGRNMFWELWKGAEMKINRFKTSRIYWYDVPGRDEQFKIDTIANIGEEAWEMGFECSFDTQLKSIFNTPTQKLLRENQLRNESLWSKNNNYLGEKFNMEFISQDIIKYDLKKDYFLLGIDIAEGLEQDASTAKLKKLTWDIKTKKLIYESVAIMKDNEISVEDFAQWTMDFSKNFDKTKLRIVVENNTYGGEFFGQVKSLKLNNPEYSWFDNSVFAKFMRKAKEDFELGIRWNGNNKKVAVKSFSSLISTKTMVETHFLSIEEYLNFGRLKNNKYAANYGHDDLVMADVSISHFIKSNNLFATEFFNRATEELRLLLNDEDEEVKKIKAEKLRKEQNIYRTENGFQLRNHQEYVDKDKNNDLYLFDLIQ